jgi:hypothetical protein
VALTELVDVWVFDRIVYAVGGTVVRCALVGAFLVVLSGCGGEQPPSVLPPAQQTAGTDSAGAGAGPVTNAPTTGPTSTVSPGSPGTVNVGDPLSVYEAWWSALERALASANSNEPALSLYGANPLLDTTRVRLFTLAASQIVQVVHFQRTPQVVGRTPSRVDVLDCVRGPAGTYRDRRTGQPRTPAGSRNDIATHDSVRSVLQLIAGRWYVTAIQAGGKPC